ncbi:MAG TPA: site-2 protease family protein [Candidatus Paceibacterota bacterium]|nr:site-2 protease family protein [Candidatus Paceibacterota bacterium]
MAFQFIFSLIVLLFSVIIHEVAHGYAALAQGDRTAEYEGRLTLNPLKHIDPVGTIILPALSLMLPGSFLFGWAKPVPFNPYNLRNQRWGEAIVAAAGPLSNLGIAFVFGLIIRFYIAPQGMIAGPAAALCAIIALVNVTLAIFNLIPIPPLDGSKILSAILPRSWMRVRQSIERLGFIGVLIFLVFLWPIFEPVIPWLFRVITGVSL